MPAGAPVLCTSKGIEVKTLKLMAEILPETLGRERAYAFLSGPSFAKEIALGMATAVVVASEDARLARDISRLVSSDTFRVFTSRDVVGLEVGGAVKNVIALAAGMCEGLDLGTNAMAALVTRGCYEMRRIGLSMGGKSETFMGLSGVGDTFGTCFGPLSRNRNLGVRLGRGERLKDILSEQDEVAEGVDTAPRSRGSSAVRPLVPHGPGARARARALPPRDSTRPLSSYRPPLLSRLLPRDARRWLNPPFPLPSLATVPPRRGPPLRSSRSSSASPTCSRTASRRARACST